MQFDWKKLLSQIIPIILSWLLGALGIGVPQLTPDRLLNRPATVTGATSVNPR